METEYNENVFFSTAPMRVEKKDEDGVNVLYLLLLLLLIPVFMGIGIVTFLKR